MDAKFKSLQLIKGENAQLIQGIKGNKVPKGAIVGGNGSFIVYGKSTQVILFLELENGKNFSCDVYRKILNYYGRKKMTDKFFEQLKVDMAKKKYTVDMETYDVQWS